MLCRKFVSGQFLMEIFYVVDSILPIKGTVFFTLIYLDKSLSYIILFLNADRTPDYSIVSLKDEIPLRGTDYVNLLKSIDISGIIM